MAESKTKTDNFSLEEDDIFEDFETAGVPWHSWLG
jgi:hypothetical protein